MLVRSIIFHKFKIKKDDRVVVETARGLELGEISQELKDISEFNLDTELKKIVRKATKKI